MELVQTENSEPLVVRFVEKKLCTEGTRIYLLKLRAYLLLLLKGSL